MLTKLMRKSAEISLKICKKYDSYLIAGKHLPGQSAASVQSLHREDARKYCTPGNAYIDIYC